MIVLHDYFRSGASHRVRAALHLKGLAFVQKTHHLRKMEQKAPDYVALNPQGLVPTLEHDGIVVTQSMAILEYLEEAFPETVRLLPTDVAGRARVRSLANIIAADTHPINNLRILAYLETELGLDEAARFAWCRRWLGESFAALEVRLAQDGATGTCCHGDAPSFADLCLAPQVLSARRFGLDLAPYPTAMRIHAHLLAMPAFQKSEPAVQPDAE